MPASMRQEKLALAGLQSPQRGIGAALSEKFIKGTAFNNAGGLHQMDAMRLSNRGQTVRNHDGGAVLTDHFQRTPNGRFGFVVNFAGGIVQDQDRWVIRTKSRGLNIFSSRTWSTRSSCQPPKKLVC